MSWKTLGSKVVYENPFFTVLEDHVINPGGGENQYGYVQFKTRAVAIVPLDDYKNTWLVGQQRYTLNAYSWEVPMGGANVGEDILDAAKRELKEETGLSANQWTEIMHLHTSNSITDEEGFVFTAEDLTEGEPEFEETEQLEIKKLPLTDALDMVDRGEITDAISVAAILKISASRKS